MLSFHSTFDSDYHIQSEVSDIMPEKKAYHTRQHEQLLAYFCEHPHESFSARDIIEHSGLELGEATVYRLLTRLTRDGQLVRSIPEGGGGSVYTVSPESACSGHIHLKCTGCSEVICADSSVLGDFSGRLSDELSFSVDSSRTTIYGLCASCRRKRAGSH